MISDQKSSANHYQEPPLLVVCGPTATGKTELALRLASTLDGQIISADSRQVYKGLDIGTGKDLSPNSVLQPSNITKLDHRTGFYKVQRVKVWGLDLVNPEEEFSVADYVELVTPLVNKLLSRKILPVIVGGTGFYIDALVSPPATLGIPPNQPLRRELNKLSAKQLLTKLLSLSPKNANRMNQSDRHNPRRLIRSIETALAIKNKNSIQTKQRQITPNQLWIGLKAPISLIEKKINTRINQRLSAGFNNEVLSLMARNIDWSSNSATALGYRQWRDFLHGNTSRSQAISLWRQAEVSYAKRQLTWFNQRKQIHWFPAYQQQTAKKIEALVKDWYIRLIGK